jgi:hypothetical protein
LLGQIFEITQSNYLPPFGRQKSYSLSKSDPVARVLNIKKTVPIRNAVIKAKTLTVITLAV